MKLGKRGPTLPEEAILEPALAAFAGRPQVMLTARAGCAGGATEAVFEFAEAGRSLPCRLKIVEHLSVIPVAAVEASRQPQLPAPLIFVTGYVPPGQAEALRRRGIQFIDAAGNCHVALPGLYVFVKGQACHPDFERLPRNRLLQSSGLKVVFVYLAGVTEFGAGGGPGPSATLETVAALAGVSLGTASNTRRELLAAGHLVAAGSGYELVAREELCRQWVRPYAERLVPKLRWGRYRSPAPDWWRRLDVAAASACWGGEPAAAILAGSLQPGSSVVYTWSAPKLVIMAGELQPDPVGDVELRRAFWPVGRFEQQRCVHPLLVYADLVASDEPRSLSVAEGIYERYLSPGLQRA